MTSHLCVVASTVSAKKTYLQLLFVSLQCYPVLHLLNGDCEAQRGEDVPQEVEPQQEGEQLDQRSSQHL